MPASSAERAEASLYPTSSLWMATVIPRRTTGAITNRCTPFPHPVLFGTTAINTIQSGEAMNKSQSVESAIVGFRMG